MVEESYEPSYYSTVTTDNMKLPMTATTTTCATPSLSPYAMAAVMSAVALFCAKRETVSNHGLVLVVYVFTIVYFVTNKRKLQKRIEDIEARAVEEYQSELKSMQIQYDHEIDQIMRDVETQLDTEKKRLEKEYKDEFGANMAQESLQELLKLEQQHQEELKGMEQRLGEQRQQLEQENKRFVTAHAQKEQALQNKIEALETALFHF